MAPRATATTVTADDPSATARLRFDRFEWAGAFGDLGTLIPFVVAYISLLDVNPGGLLLSFGLALIVTGCYYRTPIPVQPMKAIGAVATTQAAQNFVIAAHSVYAAGLVTGLIWCLLAVTGLAQRLARLTPRPLITGLVLGLGISLMLTGVERLENDLVLGAVVLLVTLLLLGNRRLPVMFLLLPCGIALSLMRDPALAARLGELQPAWHWPVWTLPALGWQDFVIGTLFLALPQVPLTLGNALIAITEQNNRRFPQRRVDERRIALSTGLMNLFGANVGGVPMCHGAGGFAAHVRFGARSGGATVILGSLLLALGLGFGDSVTVLLRLFPDAVLGTLLFITGAQLALGSCHFGPDKRSRFTAVTTAALALWNVGAAVLFGLLVHRLLARGWIRL